MKTSEIVEINKSIVTFIQSISQHQDSFIKELPDVWGAVLSSVRTLSDVAGLLDAAKNFEFQEDLEFYNSMLIANKMKPTGSLPPSLLNNDRDVDFTRFVSSKEDLGKSD